MGPASERRYAMTSTSTMPAAAKPVEDDDAVRVSVGADGPSYRGYAATFLADAEVPFEGVAELLWTGAEPRRAWWPVNATPGATLRRLPPLDRVDEILRFALTAAAIDDPHRDEIGVKDDLARARRLIPLLAAVVGGAFDRKRIAHAMKGRTVAERLVVALGGDRRDGPVLDRALVLCADHPDSGADRMLAAAAVHGADLYGCLAIALAAPRGNRNDALCRGIEDLVEAVGSARWAADVVGDRLLESDVPPGFGHPSYPEGDPRAARLLALAREHGGNAQAMRTMDAIAAAMAAAGHEPPRLAFGLVAISRALGLARGSGGAIFAIARLAGRVGRVAARRPAGAAVARSAIDPDVTALHG